MNRSAVEAFQLLGIPRDSDRATIAHAYRRLARAIHPDVSTDADASERFASLTEAYRIATTAPTPAARVVERVPIRRVRASGQDAPIVAGPVRVRPPSDHGEGLGHG